MNMAGPDHYAASTIGLLAIPGLDVIARSHAEQYAAKSESP